MINFGPPPEDRRRRMAQAVLAAESGAAPATPEDIASRQRMAQSLIQEGSSGAPVGHWTQALNRGLQGLSGGMMQAQASSDATARAAYDEQQSTAKRMAERLAAMDDKKHMTEWERSLPPTEAEKLNMDYKRAQLTQLQQKPAVDSGRIERLLQLGINPDSAEGQAFILNGKLPAAAYEQIAQRQRRQATAPNIAAGLQNLNNLADDYDDASFTNAVGPFQGSTPDGLLGSIPINIARLFGEAANAFEGGGSSPTEVRNNIVGNTEALAAAIKPLIRAPGEGVWTDQDQARLVSIVGDLAQARDKDEYRRRLNAVKDRVRANFNLDIPFDAFGSPGGAAALQNRGARPFVQQDGWAVVNGVKIRESR
jgi:hypothetical protein